jgi:PPK2 family polyphosphate:nucleotide phosphotransferase
MSYRIAHGESVSLADRDCADTGSDTGDEELPELVERIADLQARLYAEEERALLVVLQGHRRRRQGLHGRPRVPRHQPAGRARVSFKQPSNEEAAHDLLWRYHLDTPAYGMIHVFNRSHYEDVLVVRVKGLVEEKRWRSRYDSINDFERMLSREGTTILKCFLHISKDAQLERFRERLARKDKHYKFSAGDVRERRHWDAYQEAYEDALNATHTDWARWHIVPADHKWFRNLTVARLVAETLERMDPRWPPPEEDLERFAAEELDQLSSR